MEYRLTMKAKSKSSQNGPSVQESGELPATDQEPQKENTYDTDSNDSIDRKIRRESEAVKSRDRLPVRRPAVMKDRRPTKNIIKVSSFN